MAVTIPRRDTRVSERTGPRVYPGDVTAHGAMGRGAARLLGSLVTALALGTALTACAIRPPFPLTTPARTGTRATVPPPDASSTPSATGPCPAPVAGLLTEAPGTGRTVALTFDDGPAPADLEIVPILARFGVHATFFETGRHVADSPRVSRYVADAGNLVEDHSWDHLYPREVLGGWTRAYLVDQFGRTRAQLSATTHEPVCFVRPPGGFDDHVVDAANSLGMTPVLWSVDGLDWKQPGTVTPDATAAIVANATRAQGQEHPIVLLHSGKASHEPGSVVSPFRGNTVAALPKVIQWYLDQGYTFVRLDGTT